MNDTLKIARLKIENILGVKNIEFSPNAGFNEISGPNGSGKTSVLEAIKAATGSGHDATLLRKGAEKGEIVLVLDDQSTEICKRVQPDKTDVEMRRDGKKVSGPATAIKELTDMISVNPVDFLRAPKKDRVRVLLDSMPLEADPARLSELAGIPLKIAEGTHALQAIDAVHKQIFDERTGTNRAIKEKDGTIKQLTEAMPEAPGGAEGDEDSLTQQLETARVARDNELERIRVKLGGIQKDTTDAIQALRDEAQAKIDAIKAELEQAVEAKRAELADIEGKANLQRDRTKAKFDETAAPLNNALAAIRSNRDLAAKREQQKKLIEQMRDEYDELVEEAAKLTAALNGIEAYKSELLSSLPIDGLEVKDGEIFRHGVALDRLNTAQQVKIAIEIAKLRAGQLGIMCVDGIELLDSDSYQELKNQVAETDLQMFVARVDDQPFTINPN